MHPSIQYELMKTRVADLQREANQDAIARAVSRARREQRRNGTHRLPGLSTLAQRLPGLPRARRSET